MTFAILILFVCLVVALILRIKRIICTHCMPMMLSSRVTRFKIKSKLKRINWIKILTICTTTDVLDGIAHGGLDSNHGPKPLRFPQQTRT